jgi:hypothetical protein
VFWLYFHHLVTWQLMEMLLERSLRLQMTIWHYLSLRPVISLKHHMVHLNDLLFTLNSWYSLSQWAAIFPTCLMKKFHKIPTCHLVLSSVFYTTGYNTWLTKISPTFQTYQQTKHWSPTILALLILQGYRCAWSPGWMVIMEEWSVIHISLHDM